jgi:hypothetical protein
MAEGRMCCIARGTLGGALRLREWFLSVEKRLLEWPENGFSPFAVCRHQTPLYQASRPSPSALV